MTIPFAPTLKYLLQCHRRLSHQDKLRQLPMVPAIGPLTVNLLASADKLCFLSNCVQGSNMAEWALVRVDLQRSVLSHPSTLQDGQFLVDFYTCQSADKMFNALNQRYWLEYHPKFDLSNPYCDCFTHMIRPSAQLPSYAVAEGL